jgi:16S rRNA (cytosine1402-N4)-methyltransferase
VSDAFEHQPVMAEEIVTTFASVPPGYVLDATLGGAGHASALLEAHPHLRILGLDRDQDALAAARDRMAAFGDRVVTEHLRFDQLDTAMDKLSLDHLSGALFDLGVSSPQLDRAERGFSYRNPAPLDMRMDQTEQWTAADIVNGYDADRLARVLRQYGDERFATRIARAIVAARPIETTTQLSEVVVGAIPAPARRTGGHPAKRTFQALRIELNQELAVLPGAIATAIERTEVGGRLAVLSYHSGEDRIVKEQIRLAETGGCSCPPELPCVCDAVQIVRVVRGIARTPSEAEKAANPRARSARLRVAERISPTRRAQDQTRPTQRRSRGER